MEDLEVRSRVFLRRGATTGTLRGSSARGGGGDTGGH